MQSIRQEIIPSKRDSILEVAIPLFGRFGFRKTSVDEVARAANISKQGLYLHFASKEEVFLEAMKMYLNNGLRLVDQALEKSDERLSKRLVAAMDAWFGRHLATFAPTSLDVIPVGNQMAGREIDAYKTAFRKKMATAISLSEEFKESNNVCSPEEIADVLFQFGLTWKEGYPSRAEFMKEVFKCVKATCQIRANLESEVDL